VGRPTPVEHQVSQGALEAILGAVIRLGGTAVSRSVYDEAGYSFTVFARGVRKLVRTGCLIRPRVGTLVITDRGIIAYALYQGKNRASYEKRHRQQFLVPSVAIC